MHLNVVYHATEFLMTWAIVIVMVGAVATWRELRRMIATVYRASSEMACNPLDVANGVLHQCEVFCHLNDIATASESIIMTG